MKLNKPAIVQHVYQDILNAIDNPSIDLEDDILVVKRDYFTKAQENAINTFANTWFVDIDELYYSAQQYEVGMEKVPNIGGIINSKDFSRYKAEHPEAKALKYGPEMKRKWRVELDDVIVALRDELR